LFPVILSAVVVVAVGSLIASIVPTARFAQPIEAIILICTALSARVFRWE